MRTESELEGALRRGFVTELATRRPKMEGHRFGRRSLFHRESALEQIRAFLRVAILADQRQECLEQFPALGLPVQPGVVGRARLRGLRLFEKGAEPDRPGRDRASVAPVLSRA